jgi:aminoglycoside 6-adenylyltransferase
MRTEQQMLDLILETARCDEHIRAVIMNGSRANPNAPRDPFQDFDVVYIVTDVEPFRHNYEWIKRFGELMILQMPEDMQDPPPDNGGFFSFLMQFMDGNRIDLGLFTLSQWKEHKDDRDSLSVLLLDKDGIIKPFPPASEADYLPKPPTAKAFADCCNEFWWVSPYVAKGLWRQEILYAKCMMDEVVRNKQLMKMLQWHIGVKTDFKINPGKLGKYFQKYLEPELWDMLLKTFADASYENTWDALFTMCDLFRKVAVPIAEHFGFEYPFDDDRRVSAHLEHVRFLPGDAKEMYS